MFYMIRPVVPTVLGLHSVCNGPEPGLAILTGGLERGRRDIFCLKCSHQIFFKSLRCGSTGRTERSLQVARAEVLLKQKQLLGKLSRLLLLLLHFPGWCTIKERREARWREKKRRKDDAWNRKVGLARFERQHFQEWKVLSVLHGRRCAVWPGSAARDASFCIGNPSWWRTLR